MTTIRDVEKPGFFKRTHEVLTEGSYKSYKILFSYSALVILCIASLVIILRKGTTLGEFIEGVSVESVGMLFDILVLGLIFNFFKSKGERKKEIKRYLEEIDDYRGWDEKEAMFRIVGNIKRLIKLGQKNLPLYKCYLQKANLFKADLQKAIFQAANLQGANLQRANLQGANLHEVNLQGANLYGAYLQETYLERADLRGVDLQEADLQRTDLRYANLQNTSLFRANFLRANLDSSNLKGANFQQANLQLAYLDRADLQGADLQGANLQDVNLQEANLKDAKGLTLEMLLKTKTLYYTKGLDPELEEALKVHKPELFQPPSEED